MFERVRQDPLGKLGACVPTSSQCCLGAPPKLIGIREGVKRDREEKKKEEEGRGPTPKLKGKRSGTLTECALGSPLDKQQA